jgi:hypothetical protein
MYAINFDQSRGEARLPICNPNTMETTTKGCSVVTNRNAGHGALLAYRARLFDGHLAVKKPALGSTTANSSAGGGHVPRVIGKPPHVHIQRHVPNKISRQPGPGGPPLRAGAAVKRGPH